MRDTNYMIKFSMLLSVAALICIFCNLSPQARAQGEGAIQQLLQQIATNTLNTVNQLTTSNTYLPALNTYLPTINGYTYNTVVQLGNVNATDNPSSFASTPTPTLQQDFATLGTQIIADFNSLLSPAILQSFNQSLFGNTKLSDFKSNTNIDPNALSYFTLLNQPPVPDKPNNIALAVKTYVQNASGLGLSHSPPDVSWQGNVTNQKRYSQLYQTLMSVASYNSFVLGNMLVENQNGGQLTTLQNNLIKFATSSSSLFTQIAAEPIGLVLRQLLLFQTQSYVVLTQLLQAQQQLLYAHVMTNTLLISNAQMTESLMTSQAQGLKPSP